MNREMEKKQGQPIADLARKWSEHGHIPPWHHPLELVGPTRTKDTTSETPFNASHQLDSIAMLDDMEHSQWPEAVILLPCLDLG